MFPNRPTHPDFERLAAIVRYHDDHAYEAMGKFNDLIGQTIDPDTAAYMSLQRVVRAMAKLPIFGDPVAGASIWLDGFLAGSRFAAKPSTEGRESGQA